MRKTALALTVLLVGFTGATAEEFVGAITKVEGAKIEVVQRKKGAPAVRGVLNVVANCKVTGAVFNKDTKKLEAGELLEGGLKNVLFTRIGEKGLSARITTDGDGRVTGIMVFQPKKKE